MDSSNSQARRLSIVAQLLPERIAFQRATRASTGFNSFDASSSSAASDGAGGLDIGILPAEAHVWSPRRVEASLRIDPRSRAVWPGLVDLGKTSYIGAVVQCLARVPPLVDFLLDAEASPATTAASRSLRFDACDVLGALLREMRSTAAVHRRGIGSVEPQGLVRSLRSLSRDFAPGRQEDAFTFLQVSFIYLFHDRI